MSLTVKTNNLNEALAVIQTRIAARPEMQEQMTKMATFFSDWYSESLKLYGRLFDEELKKFLNESR